MDLLNTADKDPEILSGREFQDKVPEKVLSITVDRDQETLPVEISTVKCNSAL